MAELYEALYAYSPQSPEDMQFEAGDRIELTERLSNDWARGKNERTGAVGVFPMNYVKQTRSGSSEKFSRPAAPVPGNSGQSGFINSPQAYNDNEKYQPPPPSWQASQQQYQQPQQQYQPPQPYYPNQQQQYQPPVQYQQQQQQYPQNVMMPQQQPQQQKKHRFGGIAKRFGDSVVFGAGATLGSDLINKIFWSVFV